MFRLSQIRDSRPRREAKIKLPADVAATRYGGTYLADMLAPDRNSFAIIRMAMALAVLVSHSYWFTIGTTGSQPLVGWTGHSLGEHAVQVFFLLSGILVAQSLHRSGSVVDYACARALRIFPALAVCVVLTAFVLGPIVTNLGLAEYLKDNRVAGYIVKTLTLSTGSAPLPGVFTDVPLANLVNVSLWTLKFEVLGYMALAGLGIAGLMTERYRAWSAVGLGLFVSLVFLRQPLADAKYTAIDNIRYLMLFFFTGVLAFQCRTWLLVHGLIVIPLAALFAASIGTRFVEVSAAVFLGYTMLWVATFSFGPLRAFTNKNDYSYGTYIYAGPIQQMIVHFLPGVAPWVVTAFAVGIAVPLAVYSWELIERPALGWRQPIRNWLFGIRRRLDAMLARTASAPLEHTASAFASTLAAAPVQAPGPVGTDLAADALVKPALTTVPPRRQRRRTIVGPGLVASGPANTIRVPALATTRRHRPALNLKIVKISPEVAAMHQSKSLAVAVARTRTGQALMSAPDVRRVAAATGRTPYARNWLMSLGWLATPGVAVGNQLPANRRAHELNHQHSRPGQSLDIGKLMVTTPAIVAPVAQASDDQQPEMTSRLRWRAWLATLTRSRQSEPHQPELISAEIPAERMAQALRPRAQRRPKWTVPANDTARVSGADPLPI